MLKSQKYKKGEGGLRLTFCGVGSVMMVLKKPSQSALPNFPLLFREEWAYDAGMMVLL